MEKLLLALVAVVSFQLGGCRFEIEGTVEEGELDAPDDAGPRGWPVDGDFQGCYVDCLAVCENDAEEVCGGRESLCEEQCMPPEGLPESDGGVGEPFPECAQACDRLFDRCTSEGLDLDLCGTLLNECQTGCDGSGPDEPDCEIECNEGGECWERCGEGPDDAPNGCHEGCEEFAQSCLLPDGDIDEQCLAVAHECFAHCEGDQPDECDIECNEAGECWDTCEQDPDGDDCWDVCDEHGECWFECEPDGDRDDECDEPHPDDCWEECGEDGHCWVACGDGEDHEPHPDECWEICDAQGDCQVECDPDSGPDDEGIQLCIEMCFDQQLQCEAEQAPDGPEACHEFVEQCLNACEHDQGCPDVCDEATGQCWPSCEGGPDECANWDVQHCFEGDTPDPEACLEAAERACAG